MTAHGAPPGTAPTANAPAPAAALSAQAPAPPAAIPAAAPPRDDHEVRELRERLERIDKALESMASKPAPAGQPPPANQLDALEERMKSLMHLSEVLSVRYNPFLDEGEGRIFDGDEKPSSLGRDPAREPVRADRPDLREVVRPPETSPAGHWDVARQAELGLPAEAPGLADAALARSARPPRPARQETQAHEESAPVAAGPVGATASHDEPAAPLAPAPGQAVPARAGTATAPLRAGSHGRRPEPIPVGRTREAYLTLRWYEYLMRADDPSAIHLFLEHYRTLGWIPDEGYAWMKTLALGVAPEPEPAELGGMGIDPRRLAALHLANLRFLDGLFHPGFARGESGRLDAEAKGLLEAP